MAGLNIQLNADERPAVIGGGDRAAARSLAALERAGLIVRLCCADPAPWLRDLIERRGIDWRARPASAADVAAARLVISASAEPASVRDLRQLATDCGRPFHDAVTGGGDFVFDTSDPTPVTRDDPWQHVQVCLVGAGPGDPGLLTLDGERALRGADVILYDRLVSPRLLSWAPADAEHVFVGKRRGHHYYRQSELNRHMIALARAGRRVLRLKGGDPFVFGRGGEELVELAAAGIATRAIPGVTAGSGCATYADIPLTHRDYAAGCEFLTAHGQAGEMRHDWAALVRSRHTLVIYMGVLALTNLCPALVAHGMDPETPAALIERGTRPEQRVLTGTVTSLPTIARRHTVTSPAVLIVGSVVSLRETVRAARRGRLPESAVDHPPVPRP